MVGNIIARSSFFQSPVIVVNAGACAIRVTVVYSLFESVGLEHRQADSIALLHPHGPGMVCIVTKVGVKIDGPELGIRPIVLRRLIDLVQHRGVRRDVQRNLVDVPVFQKSDAGRSFIQNLRQPVR